VSLNVKNPRAYELARRLSDLTGESLTSAVIHALESKLAEEENRRTPKTTAARILAFSERFASGMPRNCKSSDHATLLYGDDGLPR
jgi:antitoxin VapB